MNLIVMFIIVFSWDFLKFVSGQMLKSKGGPPTGPSIVNAQRALEVACKIE